MADLAEASRRFQDWFRAASDAAIDTPLGTIMNDKYFRVGNLGGGLLGWEKTDASEKFQIIITVSEEEKQPCTDELGTDLADPETAEWIVGVHGEDGEYGGDTAIGLTAALALAEKMLAAPADFIEKA